MENSSLTSEQHTDLITPPLSSLPLKLSWLSTTSTAKILFIGQCPYPPSLLLLLLLPLSSSSLAKKTGGILKLNCVGSSSDDNLLRPLSWEEEDGREME